MLDVDDDDEEEDDDKEEQDGSGSCWFIVISTASYNEANADTHLVVYAKRQSRVEWLNNPAKDFETRTRSLSTFSLIPSS